MREKRGRGRAKSRWIAAVTVDYPAIEYEQCLPRSPHTRTRGSRAAERDRGAHRVKEIEWEVGETSPVVAILQPVN